MVPDAAEGAALVTNPVYAELFAKLGWGSTLVGIVLVLLIPFLRRLIKDRGPSGGEAQAPLAATT